MTYTMRARPTDYAGVSMRSRLEAAWAEQFDAMGWGWEYEPKCYAAPGLGQYLPDFKVSIPGVTDRAFVEVKPASWVDPANNNVADVPEVEWKNLIESARDPWMIIHWKIGRRWRIIRESERCDLFLVCTSANADGQAEIWGQTRGVWAKVAPTTCGAGCHSFAHYAASGPSFCLPHRQAWGTEPTVASLYAPNGFSVTPGWGREVFTSYVRKAAA